jgi:hypothetical protein
LWEGLVEEGQEECERVIRAQRLGSVESSATNEKKLHYKRVWVCGKPFSVEKWSRESKSVSHLKQKLKQRKMHLTMKSTRVDRPVGRKGGGNVGMWM